MNWLIFMNFTMYHVSLEATHCYTFHLPVNAYTNMVPIQTSEVGTAIVVFGVGF
jgi:hypothetical protein